MVSPRVSEQIRLVALAAARSKGSSGGGMLLTLKSRTLPG